MSYFPKPCMISGLRSAGVVHTSPVHECAILILVTVGDY